MRHLVNGALEEKTVCVLKGGRGDQAHLLIIKWYLKL